MSSRELLVLLDGLPDTAKYKESTERTFRVVQDDKGQLFMHPAIGPPPKDMVVITEYVDWTHDRKLLARNTSEIASMRADGRDYQPDLTGLIEPLTQILDDRQREEQYRFTTRAENFIRDGLHGRR